MSDIDPTWVCDLYGFSLSALSFRLQFTTHWQVFFPPCPSLRWGFLPHPCPCSDGFPSPRMAAEGTIRSPSLRVSSISPHMPSMTTVLSLSNHNYPKIEYSEAEFVQDTDPILIWSGIGIVDIAGPKPSGLQPGFQECYPWRLSIHLNCFDIRRWNCVILRISKVYIN